MGDALRVLALHHGVLWLDEIRSEILGLRYTVEKGVVDFNFEELKKAIDRLRGLDLVDYEEGFRATLSTAGAVKDLLVKLKDRGEVLAALSNDLVFKRYLAERSKMYKLE